MTDIDTEYGCCRSSGNMDSDVQNNVTFCESSIEENDDMFFSTTLMFGHIVYFTFRRPPSSKEEFQIYRQVFTSYYDSHEKFLLFFDIRDLEGISFEFITLKAQLLSDLKPRSSTQVKGTAIIAESDFALCTLKAMFSIYKLTTPHKIFDNDTDATSWLLDRLTDVFGEDELRRQMELEQY